MPCKFGKDWIEIMDYEFFPATVYPNTKIFAREIEFINILGAPPEIKIGNELIFITDMNKVELFKFGVRNHIKIPNNKKEKPFDIWWGILGKFLDIVNFEKQDKIILKELEFHGLDAKIVKTWRDRVQNAMVSYKFLDTGYWDWGHLGQWDMLQAHLSCIEKIGEDEFEKLYWDSMKVALLGYEKI